MVSSDGGLCDLGQCFVYGSNSGLVLIDCRIINFLFSVDGVEFLNAFNLD